LEFFSALAEHAFLRQALIAGLLISVSCGVVGTYVVTRRITYIAGGVAHCVLGGMGGAQYLRVVYGWSWFDPIYGALIAALASALTIGWVSLRVKEREDTVISALWAIGMAAGVIFIWRTPGYSQDLVSYLFGDILMVSQDKLWLVAGLDAVVLGLVLVFYKQFMAVCFDEEFAELRGVRVGLFYLLLLAITALTVVLLVIVVGIVLVIALLTLPVAIAGHFAKTLWQMMLASVLLTMLFTSSGLALSYGPNLPAGATTVVLAATVYVLTIVAARLLGRTATR
jgi:zinc transport system permease protein